MILNLRSIEVLIKMSTRTRSKSAKLDINKEKSSHYFDSKDKNEPDLIEDNDNSNKTKKRKISKPIEIKYESKPPKNWQKVLENLREMRLKRDAVVDSMGAEMCFDQNAVKETDKRFQVLVSLMLSSQTRDQITDSTMERLKEHGLTIENIINTNDEQLTDLIKSVAFYRRKVKYIKETALILRDKYNNDIPNSLEALLSLPGVGPKMAHLAMKIAWNQCTGIAVDTHVHRICNRLGWAESKTPEQTMKQFMSWLPKEHWDEINLLLVGFGQTICSPVKPKCGECLNKKLCPYALSLESDSDF